MKTITTSYYDNFMCTAGKCPLTCCQQWRIAVDDDTCRRWRLIPDFASVGVPLSSNIGQDKDGDFIEFGSSGSCRCLTCGGLCGVQKLYGEEAIPETCRTFPRIEKHFNDHCDSTAAAGCPAVVDMMNTSKFSFTGEGAGSHTIRSAAVRILSNESYSCEAALKICFYEMLDLRDRMAGSSEDTSIDNDISVSDDVSAKISEIVIDPAESMYEDNALLRDLMSDYIKQGRYGRYIADIEKTAKVIDDASKNVGNDTDRLTADNTTRDAAQMTGQKMDQEISQFQKSFHIYEPLMKNYLMNEVFTDLASPDSMLTGTEWTALCYACVKQYAFIFWKNNGGRLDYEDMRVIITITARMTGYDDEGIREYLNDRFVEPVWDWGYFALVTG